MAERLLITCEHGGNSVPARYAPLFLGSGSLLHTHRGWDPGALLLARELAAELRAPLVQATTTRLLVDLNRSIGHPDLFSLITRNCGAAEKARILFMYYYPFRRRVDARIAAAARNGRRVVHISVHSFAPRLSGEVRRADIGLLYDPARRPERAFSRRLRATLNSADPSLVVRRNYPYRGAADGLATHLRRHYPARLYAGIELEVNQKHAALPSREWAALRAIITRAIGDTLENRDH